MSELSGVGGAFDWLPAEVSTDEIRQLDRSNVPAQLDNLQPFTKLHAIVYNLFARWAAIKFADELAADVTAAWSVYVDALAWVGANGGRKEAVEPEELKIPLQQLREWYAGLFMADLAKVVNAAHRDRKRFEQEKDRAVVHQQRTGHESLRETAAQIDACHKQLVTTIGTLREAVLAFTPAGGFKGKDQLFARVDQCYTALMTARAELKAAAALQDPGDEGGAFGARAGDVMRAAQKYAIKYQETVNALETLFKSLDKWISTRTDTFVDENFDTLYPQTRGIVLAINTAATALGVVSTILSATGVGAVVGVPVAVLSGITGGVGVALDKISHWAARREGRATIGTRIDALTARRPDSDEAIDAAAASIGGTPMTIGSVGGNVVSKTASILGGVTRSGAARVAGHVASTVSSAAGGVGSVLGVGTTILDWRSYAAAQDVKLEQVVSSPQAQRAEHLVHMVADAVQARKNGVRLENAKVLDLARSGITLRASNGVELFIGDDGKFRELTALELVKVKVIERYPTLGTGELTYILDWNRAIWAAASDEDHVAEATVPATRHIDDADVELVLGVTSEAELTPKSISAGKTVSLSQLRTVFLDQVSTDYIDGVKHKGIDFTLVTDTCYAWDSDTGRISELTSAAEPVRKGRWFSYPFAAVASTDLFEPDLGKLAYIRGWAWQNVATGQATVQYPDEPVVLYGDFPATLTTHDGPGEQRQASAVHQFPSIATIFEALLADFNHTYSGGISANDGTTDIFTLRTFELASCGTWDGVDGSTVDRFRGNEIPYFNESTETWSLFFALPVTAPGGATGDVLGCFTMDERDGSSDWAVDERTPIRVDRDYRVTIRTDRTIDEHVMEDYSG